MVTGLVNGAPPRIRKAGGNTTSTAPPAAPNLAPHIPDRPKAAQASTSAGSPAPKTKPTAPAPYDLHPRYPEPNIIGRYRGHSSAVLAVTCSPDRKRAASGDSAGKVHVYDALDGGSLCTYSGHRDEVSTLAWSLSGTSIASGSADATVHIWDASDGGHASICRPHTARVSAVAWLFSYNSRIVSASADSTMKIWEKK